MAKHPPDPPPTINTKPPSVGGIDSPAKGQDPSTIAGENPISKSSTTMNDIEEVNTMDWDSDDVTVPIPSEKQIQIAQTNLAKETPVAKFKGESPEPKAPTRNPYAAGSRINRLIPISVFVTIIIHPKITHSKIDTMKKHKSFPATKLLANLPLPKALTLTKISFVQSMLLFPVF
jgi:hypothetical protein